MAAAALDRQILEALEEFAEQPVAARRRLRELIFAHEADPSAVCAAVLCGSEPSSATEFLAGLLAESGSLAPFVCDPMRCSFADARHLSALALRRISAFDAEVLRYAMSLGSACNAALTRAFALLRTLESGPRLLPSLMQLMRSSNRNVRADAALLIARVKRDPEWVRKCTEDADSRVRAQAVEGLWGVASADAVDLFRHAARDPHHRVSANAIVGLHLAGVNIVQHLDHMTTHDDPFFRAAAAFAMGECGCPEFESRLRQMVGSPISMVRRCAIRALVRIRKRVPNPSVNLDS
ncbi:MAG: HEAT repeat domain-containing protein [Bryobacteraceae bacterium]